MGYYDYQDYNDHRFIPISGLSRYPREVFMAVQWFPGHMAKTIREIKLKVEKADVVLEILDARIPYSSQNPMIEKITEHKPVVIVLNKADLADKTILDKWADFLKANNEKREVLSVSATKGKNITGIIEKCRLLCKDSAWFGKRAIRVMIIGVPNVGKSAILNKLAGKRKQDVRNIPGVTKELRKVNVSDKLQVTDTPGVLWHKFEDPLVGEKLAILGSVKDSIIYRDDIALKAIELLKELYPTRLGERYGIGLTEVEEKSASELFEIIGRKRGCIVSGGKVDNDKTARIVLTDIREGRLGGICLESPGN